MNKQMLLKCRIAAKRNHYCKIRMTKTEALRIMHTARHWNPIAHEAYLTKSGAKLKSLGGGWYSLSGYASDGSDILNDLTLVSEPHGTWFIPLHTLQYILKRKLAVLGVKNPAYSNITNPAETQSREYFCR